MNVGLLWYDPDPKKAAQNKIDEAIDRYRERFGSHPNTCHVNPAQVISHPHVRVVPNRWVAPFSYWIGVDEELDPVLVNEQPRPKQASRTTPLAKRSAQVTSNANRIAATSIGPMPRGSGARAPQPVAR